MGSARSDAVSGCLVLVAELIVIELYLRWCIGFERYQYRGIGYRAIFDMMVVVCQQDYYNFVDNRYEIFENRMPQNKKTCTSYKYCAA